eukprot:604908-Amphidinium_carterae.2
MKVAHGPASLPCCHASSSNAFHVMNIGTKVNTSHAPQISSNHLHLGVESVDMPGEGELG